MRRMWLPQILTVMLLIGCGDDGTVGPADTRITTEGGTVTSADGKATLTVPAGALAEAVTITIEAAPASADTRLVPGSEYIFEPDGLQFAVPARLTIEFDSVPAAMAQQADYIWLHRRSGNDWTAMEGEPVDLVTRTVRGEITGFSSYGGATSQLAADLLLAAQQLDALLTDAIAQNAIALMGTIGALLQAQTDPVFQALAQPFLDGIVVTACNAYASAVGNARDAPVDDWGVFTSLLAPVYSWEAVAAQAGALDGCPNAPLTTDQIQTLKIQQFVDFYIARLDPASFGQNFDLLTQEVEKVLDLRGTTSLLGLTSSDQRLQADAQIPLMRELRVSAYAACRDLGEHRYLGGLRSTVVASDYTDSDLLGDLQQCATRMNWRVLSDDQLVDDDGLLGGGPGPGTETITASAGGIAKGTITLSGDVREFRCADGSFAGDELIVSLDGIEVHRRSAIGGSFFPSPLGLNAETAIGTANLDPTQNRTVPLEISRESPGCGQYVQIVAPIPLVTLMLDYPPPFMYTNDFSGLAGPEWSHQSRTTSPSGERFLGHFDNATVELSLSGLPAHSTLSVELDLYIVSTWDGNNDEPGNGPDVVTISVDGAVQIMTTFSNIIGQDDHRQAYPDTYPGGSNASATGAYAINALGYEPEDDKHGDSVYRLVFDVSHSGGSAVIRVRAQGLTPFPDEFWGIDNVRVTTR